MDTSATKKSKGELALERHLQKAFKSLESSYAPLQMMMTDALPMISSTANLLEQLECCMSPDCNTERFASTFPDVKLHLVLKIEAELMKKVDELKDMVCLLKDKQVMVSKLNEVSSSLIQKYSSTVNLSVLSSASPTTPSLAHMMECLQNLDGMLHQHYYCKLHLLETVMTEESVGSGSLVDMWKEGDEVLLDTIKDDLTTVEFFLEEKL